MLLLSGVVLFLVPLVQCSNSSWTFLPKILRTLPHGLACYPNGNPFLLVVKRPRLSLTCNSTSMVLEVKKVETVKFTLQVRECPANQSVTYAFRVDNCREVTVRAMNGGNTWRVSSVARRPVYIKNKFLELTSKRNYGLFQHCSPFPGEHQLIKELQVVKLGGNCTADVKLDENARLKPFQFPKQSVPSQYFPLFVGGAICVALLLTTASLLALFMFSGDLAEQNNSTRPTKHSKSEAEDEKEDQTDV